MVKKLKLHKREIEKGFWTYTRVDMGEVDVKKGDKSVPISEEKIFDKEGDIYKCVKIGKTIYDIEKYEEGIATLTEEVLDDYEGKIYFEDSFPIIIRTDSSITTMIGKENSNLKKLKYIDKTLDRYDAKSKIFWMNKLKEAGKVDIIPTQTIITSIKEEEFINQEIEQNEIRKYLDLVIYIDMDYEYEDKTTLWDVMGLKKGNYTEVVKLLMDYGILGNDDDYFDLKYTIEAIKQKEKDLEAYVKMKKDEANFITALQKIKSEMSEEDFKVFVDNLMKAGKEIEQLQS